MQAKTNPKADSNPETISRLFGARVPHARTTASVPRSSLHLVANFAMPEHATSPDCGNRYRPTPARADSKSR
jgi:hypothetical protein